MEEDILQVVKYCTELVDDKDLEKLDLVIKYMKRYCSEFTVTDSCNKYIINLTSSNIHYRSNVWVQKDFFKEMYIFLKH